MKELEIKMPIINNTPEEIKRGQLAYIETKLLHVFVFGKFRKYRWYHKFFFKKPIEVGLVNGINTSEFKKGDTLCLDPNSNELIIY